ncbi:hypothetical protein N7510_010916 [Penicillium lagena]|uniref:uncharacterized protein n=1 Tax=Penicillium lagena TaxID=94218 RepID=UPI00254210FC|nr:uncharacterized protein N7510_010916 [Penicillium lagena]KAJ5601382.1 hypothetical protein N7510_010916 [Penicillium lagena]
MLRSTLSNSPLSAAKRTDIHGSVLPEDTSPTRRWPWGWSDVGHIANWTPMSASINKQREALAEASGKRSPPGQPITAWDLGHHVILIGVNNASRVTRQA